jgi:hypothetical protein
LISGTDLRAASAVKIRASETFSRNAVNRYGVKAALTHEYKSHKNKGFDNGTKIIFLAKVIRQTRHVM